MRTLLRFLLAILLGTAAYARPVEHWPYGRLTREADLIVIATPVSVRDTSERTVFPNLVEGGTDNTRRPVPAIGVEAAFHALSVLKGDTNMTTFVFHHLRNANLSSPTGQFKVLAFNGPVNVAFEPGEKRRFLLFLKLEPDGRYASVTGQTDPAMGIKDLGSFP
jgi:hypothetical protein